MDFDKFKESISAAATRGKAEHHVGQVWSRWIGDVHFISMNEGKRALQLDSKLEIYKWTILYEETCRSKVHTAN